MTYQNPTPVVVGLIPVRIDGYQGVLVVRRGIEPGIAKLALPGGYLELEPWQDGLTREVFEETGVFVVPSGWVPFGFASSEPNPNRLLVFATAPAVYAREIAVFEPNPEVQEIGVIFSLDGLEEQIAFPLHLIQIRRWLALGWKDNGPPGYHSLPITYEVHKVGDYLPLRKHDA